MAVDTTVLTGVERTFGRDDIIVSKTDLKGRLTYGNTLFLALSGYSEREILGQPHNIIRHPHMPRCVFKLLWDTILDRREIFAYVLNRSRNGDHYWVIAHVTPSMNASGQVVGYHSNRRVAGRKALETVIVPLYQDLRAMEREASNDKEGLARSHGYLLDVLRQRGQEPNAFFLGL
ncbi:PAS domain-containing protein [Rhodospirillum sp. A1_3_36]|uniref:PAS domain-containing protein n=1 Tax=Rhodospirillum sp. A1_3_36 TaxID=3391666 RepID=UPI0039A510A4